MPLTVLSELSEVFVRIVVMVIILFEAKDDPRSIFLALPRKE